MTIDFTCQKCEGSFEIDAEDLIDGTEKLQCPHCEAKAPTALADEFNNALVELRTQIAALSKKFTLTLSIESEDLETAEEDEEDEENEEGEEDVEEDDEDEDDDLDDEDEDEDDFEDEDADDR